MKEVSAILEKDALYTDPSTLVTFVGLHDMKRFMSEPGATTAGLALAQTFVLTARGTPMIYYGDEIGMPGGDDPDNRRDFPGGFPGDPRSAFTPAGRTPDEQSLFTRIRTVAQLRRELEPLRRGKMVVLSVTDRAIAFARLPGVVVAINAGDKHVDMTLDVSAAGLAPNTVLTDRLQHTPDVEVDGASLRVHVPTRSASIYVRR
jgi:glycosidase